MKKSLLFIVLTASLSAGAQDSLLRRNTIKLEFTSRWLYRQAYVVSYERVINYRRSWAIIAGYQNLPEVGSLGQNVSVTRDTRASGFKIGGEYRFYLAKENKYNAPRGVYIGPYLSFNNFHNEREITVHSGTTPEPALLKSNINVLNIGVQVGYQFVFNDRWSVDLSFLGPAVSNYRASLELDGNFTFDPEEVSNEILQDLITRFPGLTDLLSGSTLTSDGRLDTWSAGFRYQILVGYRFGKKK